jgi:predicted amidohydrolase
MNEKTIAAVALSNRDFPTLAGKLDEAARWVEHAGRNGAELVVLPEALNLYRADGPENPDALSIAETALDHWQQQTAVLWDAAARGGTAVVISAFVREHDAVRNSLFLVSPEGAVLGRYDKLCPTLDELEEGVLPGTELPLIAWDGLLVGGAICFDTQFADVFCSQAQRGADLFVVPSLWPGGDALNHHALTLSTPIALAYPAWSRIIDITGSEVAGAGYRYETLRFGFGTPVAAAAINFDRAAFHAASVQTKVVDIERHYGAQIRVQFDQQNCTFFIESRAESLPLATVIAEYELELHNDYLTRCRAAILTERSTQ